MASFSDVISDGAILRSVDDEDDNDTLPVDYSETLISWSEEFKDNCGKTLSCSIFIIACDSTSSAFIDVYFKNSTFKCVCKVYSGFTDEKEIPSHIKTSFNNHCEIYKLADNPQVLVAQCPNKIQPEQCFSWVEKIFTAIDLNQSEIILLSGALTCDYKSVIPQNELKSPFLNCLYTDTVRSTPPTICPTLSLPNIISSLPAQVLTYCQINGIKASLFISYTDVISLDITTIKSFSPVLSLSSLKTLQRNKDIDVQLKKILKKNQDTSLLYL